MKQKNITFIGCNFYPEDSAIGLYSTQLVEYLSEAGRDVSVITAFPYYPQWEIPLEYKKKPAFVKETRNNITIFRYKMYVPATPTFFKRILHIIDFTFGSFFNLFKIKKCDLVISIVPFTSSVFLGYIQKKRFKAKLWVHIQDFEFDAAVQTGVSTNKKWIFNILFKIEKWFFSKADIASTISHSMLKKLSEKTTAKTFYMPNWIDENQINPNTASQHSYLPSDKTKILYSGNIGDKQDWDTFISVANQLDSSQFELIIVGDGSKKEALLQNIKDLKNVFYHPPVPYHQLSDLLCSADIHILFQKTDVIDTVMPSKVLGMMASGKPSIITGHPNSEVKEVIQESAGGYYISGNNPSEIIQHLKELSQNKEKATKIGLKAREYVITNFAKDQILDGFIKELEQL